MIRPASQELYELNLRSSLWRAAAHDCRQQQRAAALPSGHEPAAMSKLAWHTGAAPMPVIDSRSARLSDTERAMLMGGACAKVYGWSPKKG
jgi:hypothetical protein